MKQIKSTLLAIFIAFTSLHASAMELGDNLIAKLVYIATWPDLIASIGLDPNRAAEHYEKFGHNERRYSADRFDPAAYLADHWDHAATCGFTSATANDANVLECGIQRFVYNGYGEGRSWSDLFALAYIASYPDLIRQLGPDPDAGRAHYNKYGRNENRRISFNIVSYLMARPNLHILYRTNFEEALSTYIANGGTIP